MLPSWQKGIVTRIIQATSNTRRYWVKIPETPVFDFKPGQFVTLDLPVHEQKNKRWRSYSIASMPDGTNVIELLVVLVPHGKGSNYIFNEIKEGSKFTLRGPQGVFTLNEEELAGDLVMICTGTGVAPFRSILQHIHVNKVPHKNIDLIFGTRTQADLLYFDEFKELEQQLPRFTYYPTLSREDWSGYKGYVHPIYESLCQDMPPKKFLLCGWKEMIDEAKQRIQAMGYDRKNIRQELYG